MQKILDANDCTLSRQSSNTGMLSGRSTRVANSGQSRKHVDGIHPLFIDPGKAIVDYSLSIDLCSAVDFKRVCHFFCELVNDYLRSLIHEFGPILNISYTELLCNQPEYWLIFYSFALKNREEKECQSFINHYENALGSFLSLCQESNFKFDCNNNSHSFVIRYDEKFASSTKQMTFPVVYKESTDEKAISLPSVYFFIKFLEHYLRSEKFIELIQCSQHNGKVSSLIDLLEKYQGLDPVPDIILSFFAKFCLNLVLTSDGRFLENRNLSQTLYNLAQLAIKNLLPCTLKNSQFFQKLIKHAVIALNHNEWHIKYNALGLLGALCEKNLITSTCIQDLDLIKKIRVCFSETNPQKRVEVQSNALYLIGSLSRCGLIAMEDISSLLAIFKDYFFELLQNKNHEGAIYNLLSLVIAILESELIVSSNEFKTSFQKEIKYQGFIEKLMEQWFHSSGRVKTQAVYCLALLTEKDFYFPQRETRIALTSKVLRLFKDNEGYEELKNSVIGLFTSLLKKDFINVDVEQMENWQIRDKVLSLLICTQPEVKNIAPDQAFSKQIPINCLQVLAERNLLCIRKDVAENIALIQPIIAYIANLQSNPQVIMDALDLLILIFKNPDFMITQKQLNSSNLLEILKAFLITENIHLFQSIGNLIALIGLKSHLV